MTGRALLFAVSLISLNAALLASASAETCVTAVNQTFANVISGVTGQPGTTVVTGVTPTFANAVTGVQTTQTPFLTSATLNQAAGTAVTNATLNQATGTAVTSATLNQATGTAVTNATLNQATGTVLTGATTGTVTGITPTPGLPTNLMVPAFAPNSPLGNNPPGTLFTFSNGSTSTNNQGTVTLNTTMGGGTVTLSTVPGRS